MPLANAEEEKYKTGNNLLSTLLMGQRSFQILFFPAYFIFYLFLCFNYEKISNTYKRQRGHTMNPLIPITKFCQLSRFCHT